MPAYIYQATTSDGQRVTGEITAERVSDAISQLEAQGLEVESIRAAKALGNQNVERDAFYARVNQALERRGELIPALNAIAEEMPASDASRDLRQLVRELERSPTAELFVTKPTTAPWLPVIVRGATSPSTATRYSRLLDDASRESENRKSLRMLLAYPLFLFVFGSVVVGFMLLLIVPTFEKMFGEFGMRLPSPTLFLFWGLSSANAVLTPHNSRRAWRPVSRSAVDSSLVAFRALQHLYLESSPRATRRT